MRAAQLPPLSFTHESVLCCCYFLFPHPLLIFSSPTNVLSTARPTSATTATDDDKNNENHKATETSKELWSSIPFILFRSVLRPPSLAPIPAELPALLRAWRRAAESGRGNFEEDLGRSTKSGRLNGFYYGSRNNKWAFYVELRR